jgi:hypothetical protein
MKLLTAPGTVRTRTLRTKPVLFGLAVLTVGLVLMGPDESPETAAVATSVTRGQRAASGPPLASGSLFELPERVADEHEVANAFAGHSWYVPPPPAPVVHREPPRPVAPPLPFSFMGQYVESGGRPVYYLVRGDKVYDVHVGDMIETTYRVESGGADKLTFTYLPLDERQTLALGR